MSQAQVLPSPSISLVNNRPATTSLAIAECFGKRHDHVMRSIKDLMDNCPEEFTAPNFGETFRTVAGPNNSQRQEKFFTVYFDGFILLVMGYTGKKALQMKLAYIEAFNAMKEQLDKLAEQERARLAGEVKEIPDASRLSKRTDPERKQLTAILNTWVGMAPIHYANARAQVNAHFGVTSVDRLTVAQVRDAIQWVQAKIDAIPPVALPPSPGSVSDESRLPIYRNGYFYPPHKNRTHVAGPREKALRDFWDTEYHMRAAELKKKFREMMDAINAATKDGLYAQAISNIGKDADTMFSVDSLLQGMYTPESMAHAAFKDAMELACLHMRMATSIATALNM